MSKIMSLWEKTSLIALKLRTDEMSLNLHSKEKKQAFFLILPSIIGMGVFFVLPFVWMIVLSFNQLTSSGKAFGFGNYIQLFSNSSFRLAATNTARFTIISVILIMSISLALALMLNKKLPMKRQLKTAFIVPLVVPVASIILFFEMIFDGNGLVNGIINAFGLTGVNWLSSDKTMAVVVVIYVWKNVGYNIILFLAGLQNIPTEYYEAASIDGANSIQQFYFITFVYLMPTSFFVFVISIMNSFKVFREVYILAGAYPHQSVYMLQHFMNNQFVKLDYYKLVSAAILMMIVITIIVFIIFKVQNRISKAIGD